MKTFRVLNIDTNSFIYLPGSKGENVLMEFNAESVGDEYHTMSELYDHRRALTVALFNSLSYYDPTDYNVIKSLLHNDGTMFDGYFIVMLINRVSKKQISYHYAIEYWDDFKIPELERAPQYDGHTSQDVIERLLEL